MAGLHPFYVEAPPPSGRPIWYSCARSQYHQEMKPEFFDVPENDTKWYPDKDYHVMYMAEIVKVLKKE